MPSVFIKTFGCQSNKSDSERILGDYLARGYTQTNHWKSADEIVINTCSVRQSAEDRVVGLVLNIRSYFEAGVQPKIILTGCILHHGEAKIRQILPGVDEILPIGEVGFNQTAIRQDKVHAWVPISNGCNSFCTYCIVPYSRGREVSRSQESILAEVADLARTGYQSITLLGQNVNSWGLEKTGISLRKLYMESDFSLSDIPNNSTQYTRPTGTPPFVTLLKQISAYKEIKKINFYTSNPWDFYPELIEEIAENPKIDRFIHLPVQSGSNRILKLMNRGYTRETYLNLINQIKTRVPDAVFGTDIIVGFPGETETDFQETVDLVRQVGFHVGFVARYSPRPGTASWKLLADDVTPAIKKKRWEILDQIINKDNLNRRPLVP
jgi:tRNA-2-methylthio-N6-dimethylallyladenosine synthase